MFMRIGARININDNQFLNPSRETEGELHGDLSAQGMAEEICRFQFLRVEKFRKSAAMAG